MDKSNESVPKRLYYLIESCVEANYMRRPNFEEICSLLIAIQNEGKFYKKNNLKGSY